MIGEVHNYIHLCAVNRWNKLDGIEAELVRMIQEFLSLLYSDIDTYSMRNLLKIYCQYLPAETESKEIQNNLVAYLLVTEIHSELSKTLFYKVFPCLLHPPTGVNLEVLSGSLRRHLLFLQDNPAYLQVRPHLVFGDSLFFDVSRSRSTDVYSIYLDQLVLGLRQVRTVIPSSDAGHLDQYLMVVINVKNAWERNADLRPTLNQFYATVNMLCVNRNYPREQLRSTFQYLLQLLSIVESKPGYNELYTDLKNDLSSLLLLYGVCAFLLYTEHRTDMHLN